MPANRFMQKGTTKFWFLPAVANGVPTVAEITAGTDVTKDISDVSGFNFENDPISTPDMDSTFTTSIPGEDTADTSSLTYYERRSAADNPAKVTMAKGTEGFLVIFPYGIAGATPAVGDHADVWPVQIASVSRAYSAGNEASKFTVTMSISAEPELEANLAA